MIKKIVLLLITFMFIITGCFKPVLKDESMSFLFAAPLKEHSIWLQARDGFIQGCLDYDVMCEWSGPVVIDTVHMESVIKTGILKGYDGIITQGVVDPDIIQSAYDHNIPVVLVDSDMPNSKRSKFMGKDFTQQAQLLLKDIQDRFVGNVHLNIAIQVAEMDFDIAKDQIAEIESVFSDHKGGYTIKSISESKSDSVRSKNEWTKVLNQDLDINVAINLAGESAFFCYEVAEEYGYQDDMLIYGVDDIESTLDLIKEDKIDGTIVTSFYDYGYRAVELLYNLKLNPDLDLSEDISPSLQLLTPENISSNGPKQ